jgi:hypothetical protein
LTYSIPAGTLVRVRMFDIPDHEFNGLIGYITNDDPYPDNKGHWYTVQLFEQDITYAFLLEELEILS